MNQYGKEIVLFHRIDRYKRRIWRFNLIEELKILKNRGKISEGLKLNVIVGEFSEGTQEIIKHAANHEFKSINIISGPKVYCEDRMEIYTLLDQYKSVNYLILPKRPPKHFMVFNENHLYIEKPHRHDEKPSICRYKICTTRIDQIIRSNFYTNDEICQTAKKRRCIDTRLLLRRKWC